MTPAEYLAKELLVETERDYILVWQFTRVRHLFPAADADERREIVLEAVRWLLDNDYVVPGRQYADGSFEQWEMTTDELVDYVDELWRREDGDLGPEHFPWFLGTEDGIALGQKWYLEGPGFIDDDFRENLFADRHESGTRALSLRELAERCWRENPTKSATERNRAVLREVRSMLHFDSARPADRYEEGAMDGGDIDRFLKRMAGCLSEDDGSVRGDVEFRITDRGLEYAESCWKGRQER